MRAPLNPPVPVAAHSTLQSVVLERSLHSRVGFATNGRVRRGLASESSSQSVRADLFGDAVARARWGGGLEVLTVLGL